MRPYYQDEYACIYHADCRTISLPECDLVLTDPPYPNGCKPDIGKMDASVLTERQMRQLIFWGETGEFPLTHTAKHRWKKPNGFGGRGYETIYERNGETDPQEWTAASINSTLAAQLMHDIYTNHPCQKPLNLLKQMLIYAGMPKRTLDPWMGSGTTLVAAKELGLTATGVEINEQYCEVAARRLSQGVLALAHIGQISDGRH